jgi:hypothetical protein
MLRKNGFIILWHIVRYEFHTKNVSNTKTTIYICSRASNHKKLFLQHLFIFPTDISNSNPWSYWSIPLRWEPLVGIDIRNEGRVRGLNVVYFLISHYTWYITGERLRECSSRREGRTLVQFKGSRVSLRCFVLVYKPCMQDVIHAFRNKRLC